MEILNSEYKMGHLDVNVVQVCFNFDQINNIIFVY